jgi:OOP family OmpA-OmpF porin
MKKTLISLAAAAAAMFISMGASAQGYVGVGAGPSKISIDCTGADACDKSSTGYKLYGGLKFPNQFAVEAVYFDWGKAKATATNVDLGTATIEGKGTGFGIGGAYIASFAPQWTGVVRLGFVQNRVKLSASLGSVGSGSQTYTGTFPYYGFGIGYNMTPNLAITGEADFSRVKYFDDPVQGAEKGSVQLLSLGLRYSF